jgi:hypothetical protein
LPRFWTNNGGELLIGLIHRSIIGIVVAEELGLLVQEFESCGARRCFEVVAPSLSAGALRHGAVFCDDMYE